MKECRDVFESVVKVVVCCLGCVCVFEWFGFGDKIQVCVLFDLRCVQKDQVVVWFFKDGFEIVVCKGGDDMKDWFKVVFNSVSVWIEGLEFKFEREIDMDMILLFSIMFWDESFFGKVDIFCENEMEVVVFKLFDLNVKEFELVYIEQFDCLIEDFLDILEWSCVEMMQCCVELVCRVIQNLEQYQDRIKIEVVKLMKEVGVVIFYLCCIVVKVQ